LWTPPADEVDAKYGPGVELNKCALGNADDTSPRVEEGRSACALRGHHQDRNRGHTVDLPRPDHPTLMKAERIPKRVTRDGDGRLRFRRTTRKLEDVTR
jgi:hypothetical protein